MASLLSTSVAPSTTFLTHTTPRSVKCSFARFSDSSSVGALRLVPKWQISIASRSSLLSHRFRTSATSSAQPETLKIVQSTIAKQLSIEESTIDPATKFADLGADSLDTVEIMMALEEQFGVSVGESGAENIATVQDAADLIEKVKAASA